jgi:hypothetical protein
MTQLQVRFVICLVFVLSAVVTDHAMAADASTWIDTLTSVWQKVKEAGGSTTAEVQELNKHRTAVGLLNLGVSIWKLTYLKDDLIIEVSRRPTNSPMIGDDKKVTDVRHQIDCVRSRLKELVPLMSAFHGFDGDKFAESLSAGLRDKTIMVDNLVKQDGVEKLPGESDKEALMREAQKTRETAANLYLATTKAAYALDKDAVADGTGVCTQ